MHVDFERDVRSELAVDRVEGRRVEAGLEPEDGFEDPQVAIDEAIDPGIDDFDGNVTAVL